MAKSDSVRLRHMLEAAQVGLSFAEDKKREDLDDDKMLSFAVVRALEIFCEAAANISTIFSGETPENRVESHHWYAQSTDPCLF